MSINYLGFTKGLLTSGYFFLPALIGAWMMLMILSDKILRNKPLAWAVAMILLIISAAVALN